MSPTVQTVAAFVLVALAAGAMVRRFLPRRGGGCGGGCACPGGDLREQARREAARKEKEPAAGEGPTPHG